MKTYRTLMPLLLLLFALGACGYAVASDRHKVLVVMSYEEDNPWCEEIKAGIDSVLASNSDISYFYMDTKVNFAGGEAKAKQAYQLYRELQPDGVITADDNAQSMFVLPYLYNKVDTPIMFCGVNAEAEKYGFPSSHVSGSLERGHVRESIAFLKQLSPDFNRVCFLVRDSPSGRSLKRQVDSEKDSYLVPVGGFYLAKTANELRQLSGELENSCDAIYIDSLEGIQDSNGSAMNHQQVFAVLEEIYRKPFIGANSYHVKLGALSAVVKTGNEQGELAAELLLKAMQGTPVSKLPVTKNYRGRRIINVNALTRHGIQPRPIDLRGVSLVKTER